MNIRYILSLILLSLGTKYSSADYTLRVFTPEKGYEISHSYEQFSDFIGQVALDKHYRDIGVLEINQCTDPQIFENLKKCLPFVAFVVIKEGLLPYPMLEEIAGNEGIIRRENCLFLRKEPEQATPAKSEETIPIESELIERDSIKQLETIPPTQEAGPSNGCVTSGQMTTVSPRPPIYDTADDSDAASELQAALPKKQCKENSLIEEQGKAIIKESVYEIRGVPILQFTLEELIWEKNELEKLLKEAIIFGDLEKQIEEIEDKLRFTQTYNMQGHPIQRRKAFARIIELINKEIELRETNPSDTIERSSGQHIKGRNWHSKISSKIKPFIKGKEKDKNQISESLCLLMEAKHHLLKEKQHLPNALETGDTYRRLDWLNQAIALIQKSV
ncbi:MAG: hypothetical protein A2007_04750 [Verrucomicrobia bacterium GWC2_42_7]|nr:MAG: hypothetical protein A2007_04750 [Verrucomicrobia bacterium GWC2_42_7]